MSKKLTTSKKYWITKTGEAILISAMPTSHLLNTIHLIERARMQQLISLEQHGLSDGYASNDELRAAPELVDMLEYYTRWPEEYSDLLKEAEKRKLIRRKG